MEWKSRVRSQVRLVLITHYVTVFMYMYIIPVECYALLASGRVHTQN